MSHSTVLVIGPRLEKGAAAPNPLSHQAWLDDVLAPFDENARVEPYRDYVDPLPENWRQTISNSERFSSLTDGGMERQAAWRSVWGESNDDPYVHWVFRRAIREGVDPTDLHAVAASYNKDVDGEAGDGEDDWYAVDDQGLYTLSTYNPKSRWDWWSLGGRWSGFFKLRPGAKGVKGRDGVFGGMDDGGVDMYQLRDLRCPQGW